MEDLLTVSEVASMLSVSTRWIHDLMKRGRIKATRRGPLWWIAKAEYERFRIAPKLPPGPVPKPKPPKRPVGRPRKVA